jgi:hypothetical protein
MASSRRAFVPTYRIYNVVQPTPGVMMAARIVFDGIPILILASIAAFLYRDGAPLNVRMRGSRSGA